MIELHEALLCYSVMLPYLYGTTKWLDKQTSSFTIAGGLEVNVSFPDSGALSTSCFCVAVLSGQRMGCCVRIQTAKMLEDFFVYIFVCLKSHLGYW